MGKFKVGDIVKVKGGILLPCINEIDEVVEVGEVFSNEFKRDVEYIVVKSHPMMKYAGNFELVRGVDLKNVH